MTATSKRRWLRLVAFLAVVAVFAGCGGSGAGQARLQEMAHRAERLGNTLRAMAEDVPRRQHELAPLAESLSLPWRRQIEDIDGVLWHRDEVLALAATAEPGAMIDQHDRLMSQPRGSRGTRSGGVSTDWVRWVWHFGVGLPEGYEDEGRALAQSWADYLLATGEWQLNRPGASGRFVLREGLTVISLYQDTPEGRWTLEIWDGPFNQGHELLEAYVSVDVRIESPETRT